MPFETGERLGPYEILTPLGAGGMGEVYRARDTKLNRDVAIKVLPAALAGDTMYMARFEREAQVLAALNHPNIATVFGTEAKALVMELVEGATLAERIGRGPLSLDETLAIARQICDALEAAHAKGIVHRDLKPANIKITSEGQVKVLDFGLAKALDGDDTTSAASATMSPTMTLAATRAGVILGTAAYMSPEQARGLPVDKRADIWAFGVVLYEMLTGSTIFAGDTISDTLAAVLRADIDFALLPPTAPASVRRLLRRCLARDRKKRLADIADARLELDGVDEPAPVAAAVLAPLKRTPWLPWALAALLPLSAGAGWWLHRTPPAPVLPATFLLAPPENAEFSIWSHAVSPDGHRFIVRVHPRSMQRPATALYIRDLAGTEYRALPGTNGASQPYWSPDGKSVVFTQDGKWRRLEVAGGAPVTLCDADVSGAAGAAWNENGTILIGAVSRGPIQRIPAGGGTPVAVTALDRKRGESAHSFPQFLPDGRFFLYVATVGFGHSLWVGDLEGKERARQLLEIDGTEALFAASAGLDSGILLVRRATGLMGVRFDARRRIITSDPFPVLERMATPRSRQLPVAVSVPARVMLFNPNAASSTLEELALLDRTGKKLTTLTPPGEMLWGHLEFSPDGARLAGSRAGTNQESVDLWNIDLARRSVSRVTFEGSVDKAQAWSPDGKRLFYMTRIGEKRGIWVTAADGAGTPQRVLTTSGHHIAASPDGRYVAFENTDGSAHDIRLLKLDEPDKVQPLISGSAVYNWPQFSPDMKWLAYISNETGRQEVYVQSFPPGNGKWQVSRDGGRLARWRRDGKELVFIQGSERVRFFSVAVRQRGTALDFDQPVQMFETPMSQRAGGNYFALSPDGQRIALNLPGPTPPGNPLEVSLDWMAAVGR